MHTSHPSYLARSWVISRISVTPIYNVMQHSQSNAAGNKVNHDSQQYIILIIYHKCVMPLKSPLVVNKAPEETDT